jgi:peroxiredoxin
MSLSYFRTKLSCFMMLLLILFSVHSTWAEEAGLQPGKKVPAFVLKDQDGNTQTIQSLAGPNGLLLLFNRSADWCPFCKSQLIDLESARRHFEARGIHVASITYDSPLILNAFATRRNIRYPMLSDETSATIDAFGVRNRGEEAVGVKAGIAIPNYFLIAPDGVIVKRYAETELLDRVTASYLYEVLFGSGTALPQTATKVPETPHVSITLAQSDASSAPGARLRLTALFNLEKGTHLYAPGAEKFGYHPIRITLEPSDLYQSNAPVYGHATILEFATLKEKVPVFESSTALTEDVWAVRSPKTNALFAEHPDLVIHGTLEYQICTDKVCFPPEKKAVSWNLHVTPGDLDTIRVAADLQKK